MSLDDLLGAIRSADADTGDDSDLAAATRLRVARSLETRARGRHQVVGLATAAGILLAGTVSWALATGHIAALWSPGPERQFGPVTPPPRPPPRPRAEIAVDPRPAPPPEAVPPPAASPAPEAALSAPSAAPAPVTRPPEPSAARPRSAAVPRPHDKDPPAPSPAVEVLYRKAHELHFHGGDPAAAVAAWDAYLAAEPVGRFSVEARYNRALLLIRIGRYAEARTALAPFARGEVAPAGYRQGEAEQLVRRLAQYE